MARATRILLWVVGGLVAVVAVVLVTVFWFAGSLYQSEQTDAARASVAFADVCARFAGVSPAFEIRGDRLVVVRTATGSSASEPAAVHVLVWSPRNRSLSRAKLPFGISVVATEPIPLEALIGVANQGFGALMEAKRRGDELNIRISDLERYGRTLLLDGMTPDGRQVLMWNE
jgi:hypothetical protein